MNNDISRRHFIAGLGAAVPAALAAGSVLAQAPAAASGPKVKLGVLGLGGRGSWIANLFAQHGGYEIVALADYFPDRVNAAGDKFGVPAGRRFSSLSGYKKVLDLKDVEAVAIETPPCFHPQQAADAVDAGKHVYLAKPVAVDVPGCQSIAESGKKAASKGLSFLVDFQTRANPAYIEGLKRVHAGAIGDLVFGEASYHCGRLGKQNTAGLPEAEARLRNWVFDKALSGDIITEQNIHTLDVMSWILQVPPLSASGTGGRRVRVDVGDCWDWFTLVFQYPNQVGISFSSRQFDGFDTKPDGILNRMFGTKGVLETAYGGKVLVRSKEFFKDESGPIYQQGAQANIAAFQKAIAEKKPDQSTVAPSVQSNLVTILGRTAAYQDRKVTWDDLLKSTERMDPKLDGLKS